jgi:hypothetical protein
VGSSQFYGHSAIGNRQSAIGNRQSAIGNRQSAIAWWRPACVTRRGMNFERAEVVARPVPFAEGSPVKLYENG